MRTLRIVAIGRFAGVHEMKETAEARPAAREPLTAAARADHDYAAGCLDAAAGCEYVDDRIRLMESGEDEWHNER